MHPEITLGRLCKGEARPYATVDIDLQIVCYHVSFETARLATACGFISCNPNPVGRLGGPEALIVVGFKKLIFWLHLICGISLGLVVFIMSLTGVVLTYEKQISRWADDYDIQPPAAEVEPLGPAALLQQAHLKTGKRPTSIQVRSSPDEPVRVSIGREAVMLDPYSGAALGEGATGVRSFFRTMIAWHRWLGQEGDGRAVGKAITGACNLGFLFIIISGSYLWWPRRWTWQYVKPVVFLFSSVMGCRPRPEISIGTTSSACGPLFLCSW